MAKKEKPPEVNRSFIILADGTVKPVSETIDGVYRRIMPIEEWQEHEARMMGNVGRAYAASVLNEQKKEMEGRG